MKIGFFGGWALACTIVLGIYRFSLACVLSTTGVMGVFVEEDWKVIVSVQRYLTMNPLLSVLIAV